MHSVSTQESNVVSDDLSIELEEQLDPAKIAKKRKLIYMTVVTGAFMFVELGVGMYTQSMALIADSFHMSSDVLSMIVAVVAVRMQAKRPTQYMSYGWERGEVLAALVNGVFLLALCFSIVINAIEWFLVEESHVRDPMLFVIVAALGLGINIGSIFVIGHDHDHGHGHSHGHSHDHNHGDTHGSSSAEHTHSHDDHSACDHNHDASHASGDSSHSTSPAVVPAERDMNMHGVFVHVVGDALGSVGALVSGLVIWLTDWEYRFYLDPITSLFIAVIISAHTAPLIRSSARVMMMGSPMTMSLQKLESDLAHVPGVLSVHDLHIWQLSQKKNVGTVHILARSLEEYDAIAATVQQLFHDYGVHMVTIQPEFLRNSHNAGSVSDASSASDVPVGGSFPEDLSSTCLLSCNSGKCSEFRLADGAKKRKNRSSSPSV
eukprot:ANDGO_03541.mRNA.1 Zinc/cadmium resistance protein